MDIINAANRIDRWFRVEEPEFCVEVDAVEMIEEGDKLKFDDEPEVDVEAEALKWKSARIAYQQCPTHMSNFQKQSQSQWIGKVGPKQRAKFG